MQQCALARARRADDGERLPAPDFEGDITQNFDNSGRDAKVFVDLMQGENGRIGILHRGRYFTRAPT